VLEAQGLTTVSISLVREHTEKLRPPRALFVPFPFGSPFGRAGDAAQQHRVLRAALALLDAPAGPVLVDLEGEEDPDAAPSPLQSGAVNRAPAGDVANEVTAMRRYHERWVEREGRTTVGVTGIPAVRFRGVVRFLQAYAAGGDADHAQRPEDVSVEVFARWCADDLKAMYLEARLMIAPPGETPHDTARWLWGETALGSLLRDVAERMRASGDPDLKRIAFGIAR
jgi:hypothetical protein